MKVLYVASNPAGAPELMLDREVTELHRCFAGAIGELVTFVAYPKLYLEELGLEIARQRPDILHLSAHSDGVVLALANADGEMVPLTAVMLRTLINVDPSPRLVYLNACNSREIAKDVIDVVPMAIGTTATIMNRTALASAVLFYERLLRGAVVETAFNAGRTIIEALQKRKTSSALYCGAGVDPKRERLYVTPAIVARFVDDECTSDKDGNFEIEVGVCGCPANTAQIVMYTDDSSFITDDEEPDDESVESWLAGQLCTVIRETPVRNNLWRQTSEVVYGDYRLFASGVTAGGEIFTVASSLSEALEREVGLRIARGEKPPTAGWRAAIARLRSMDGSRGPSAAPYSMGQVAEKRGATRRKR
jgi:hypothetical protein